MHRIVRSALAPVDRVQRRHPTIAIALAVLRKCSDDRAGRHAALVAYYAFFSLFPLLLVLVTVLGFALEGDPELRARVLDSALARFPIIGQQIERNIGALTGSSLALTIGLAGALWSGLGVMGAVRDAMNELWNVERRAQASFLRARLRALLVLVVLGASLVASALLAGLGAAEGGVGAVGRVIAFAGALAIDVVVFAAAFRWLTDARIGWRDVLPGAVAAGLGSATLLALGAWIVDRQIREASDVYGFFAVVIGLLGWSYLIARVMLLAAELNTVLQRGLWPRSLLVDEDLTPADRRVLAGEAREETGHPDERVEVRFDAACERPPS